MSQDNKQDVIVYIATLEKKLGESIQMLHAAMKFVETLEKKLWTAKQQLDMEEQNHVEICHPRKARDDYKKRVRVLEKERDALQEATQKEETI